MRRPPALSDEGVSRWRRLLVLGLVAVTVACAPGRHQGFPRTAPAHLAAIVWAQFIGMGTSGDPLWTGWPQDRKMLHRMTLALEGARRITSIPDANPQVAEPLYVGSQLELGPANGATVLVDPYPVGRTYSTTTVLALLGERWEALQAPALAAAVRGAGFREPTPTTATVAADETVTVPGGMATSPEVDITVAPQFGDDVGEASPWTAFSAGTAVVNGGEFVWKGKITVPPGYRVFHPVTGWWLWIDPVHSFEAMDPSILNVGLPTGVLPDIPAQAVASPDDALAALNELDYPPAMPPVWPSHPGTTSVTWIDEQSGNVVHATQTAVVIPDWTGYAVNITVTYRQGRAHRIYAAMWQVSPKGDAMLTAQMGKQPISAAPGYATAPE